MGPVKLFSRLSGDGRGRDFELKFNQAAKYLVA
jgi:hypothetical protein